MQVNVYSSNLTERRFFHYVTSFILVKETEGTERIKAPKQLSPLDIRQLVITGGDLMFMLK